MKHNCIVLHRLVESKIDLFEDVKVSNLELIAKELNELAITTQELNINSKSCWLITFDDGNGSDYSLALPILLKFNAKAIFFIVTSYIGKAGYLSWDQVRGLHSKGMEIGSHSVSHPNFINLSKAQKLHELIRSKEIIENEINSKIFSFSVPYGIFDKETINCVFEAQYKYCFNSKHGLFDQKERIIPRNSINGLTDTDKIIKILFPTNRIKIMWLLEDITKFWLKRLLGKLYLNMRDLLSRHR